MELTKWINLIINLLLLVVGFMIIAGVFSIIFLLDFSDSSKIKDLTIIISNTIMYILIFLPIFQLKKIIKSVSENKIFTLENVKRFRCISYPIFSIAFLSCFGGSSNIEIMSINGFSVKEYTLILLILALFALIMSHIFHEAMLVKTESEKLKEENKYTI